MGRKGGGGGTAGGTRSSGRNDVTYQRVVPRFLRGLIAEADGQGGREKVRKGENQDGPCAADTDDKSSILSPSARGQGNVSEEKIFTIVDDHRGNAEGVTKAETEEDDSIVTAKSPHQSRITVSKSQLLQGGIEKKTSRVKRPSKTFGRKDRTRLSFAESDSDSGTD
ncbi:unnamed protein product [Chondrus crispus]|uniref:Uncharacterized protein n=1 Tax=Chondrus crispus TaxID=2769 RepID=R7QD31_CHOCR|nr:unnamed protein product [Chondrus crispus]CDF35360.1 unnamed protein product [Chondrus crispus]|eukprot:XP_005715179.1 unnamed protein product [Chondrus crispus]